MSVSFAQGGEWNISVVEMRKAHRWKGELLSNKQPNMSEEIALRKLLIGNKLTEMRNSGALACSIKCKWENQLKKTEPTS